jgi:hypothetical protein
MAFTNSSEPASQPTCVSIAGRIGSPTEKGRLQGRPKGGNLCGWLEVEARAPPCPGSNVAIERPNDGDVMLDVGRRKLGWLNKVQDPFS